MVHQINRDPVDTFGHFDLFARQVVEGFITGIHKSPFHGFSVEFAEHRLYNPGESVKNIDWKVFGRTDKLFVKKYEEETNLRCQILVDFSSSMYFPETDTLSFDTPNKMYFAVHAAAVLMYVLKKQRDAFGLTFFSEDINLHTQCKSSTVHYNYLLSELTNILKTSRKAPTRNTSISGVLHQVAEMIHKRSLVIIFTDMLDSKERVDEVLPALQHLKHNKHDVVLFYVADKPKEIDFEFDKRPYKFVDMETKEEVKLNPSEYRALYAEKMNKFRDELLSTCARYNIDVIDADINAGFKQILWPFFKKRQKLH